MTHPDRPPRPKLPPLPHPAFISSGPQLDSVIEQMEEGTMPLPKEGAVWRPDAPAEQRRRLAKATGATDDMIALAERGQFAGEPVCPRCQRSSSNPNDIREGYCGNCHDWTMPRQEAAP